MLVRILFSLSFDAQYHLASYFNDIYFKISEEEVFYAKSSSREFE